MPVTIDANSIEWVTLDEVQQHLDVTEVTDETLMVQQAAQGAVEGIVGPILWRTVTRTVSGSSSIVLPVLPVVSVTSLTGAGTPVTYTANPDAGILSDVYATGPLTVTYVAGRTSVSDDIRYATLIIAAHLWQTQRGNAPAPGFTEETFDGTPGVGYAIPNRAMDLLGPHQMLPGIA